MGQSKDTTMLEVYLTASILFVLVAMTGTFFTVLFRQDFKICFKCRSKFALAVIADSLCDFSYALIRFF